MKIVAPSVVMLPLCCRYAGSFSCYAALTVFSSSTAAPAVEKLLWRSSSTAGGAFPQKLVLLWRSCSCCGAGPPAVEELLLLLFPQKSPRFLFAKAMLPHNPTQRRLLFGQFKKVGHTKTRSSFKISRNNVNCCEEKKYEPTK